jgi:catechol 2,3-dioxygenase-like lactoylglutathione lyase family enzyme
MATQSTLGNSQLVVFAATVDPKRAKEFYGETLGLRLVHEDGFALVFDANGTTLRVSTVREITLAPYTVLGWETNDIMTAAKAMQNAGVAFERFAGLAQDEQGIWDAPGGTRVAWFKDPDGNILSISQNN